MPTLHLNHFQYQDLFHSEGLKALDKKFLEYLYAQKKSLCELLLDYRENSSTLSAEKTSKLLIECAPILEKFIAQLFKIESNVAAEQIKICSQDPIFIFKSWYVMREARRNLKKMDASPSFSMLNDWLFNELKKNKLTQDDQELAVANLGQYYLSDQTQYNVEINQLIAWCVRALTDDEGIAFTQDWVSFHLPEKLDYQHLFFLEKNADDPLDRLQTHQENFWHRDGFDLTDPRMNEREILSEVNYCIYCHEKQGDFCSTGFPVKKSNPELGLKKNPLGEVMTGCPLDEKVSEMNFLKKAGHVIAPLAVVMVDNPMCPATGHRICNDCMKACIYQKQTPVDIPEIETAVLTDVLKLPWGVEIYDLLTRWNPLRPTQYVMQAYNGFNTLVIGMGPAGFSLAHHLTMEGCHVVGVDGLKIEPLAPALYQQPIYAYEDLTESLEDRMILGFGGVAEYGITARWDKNFLKLIYISLLRRSNFQVFGNVRFGGTLEVEDAWDLGFHHVSVAVGAGLPQALNIPNSLATGMRQANDFLMALQLTGAFKENHISNLQVRLPAIVIGSGLTAVDTATELQAYYIRQVEQLLFRYHSLIAIKGEEFVHQYLHSNKKQLDEFLSHGQFIQAERASAKKENRLPDFVTLIKKWGGVTIVYRRTLQESPAYRFNHEELKKALEEGVFYLENHAPERVLLDERGEVRALIVKSKGKEKTLLARAILIATGSKPNIAYEFEHRGTFRRSGEDYESFNVVDGKLEVASKGEHIKSEGIGVFTSYDHLGKKVSFLGDAHPMFHGSVVKAIASSKQAYPQIMNVLEKSSSLTPIYSSIVPAKAEIQREVEDFTCNQTAFSKEINNLFSSHVVSIKSLSSDVFELIIHAPMTCKHFRAGEFYRLQPFESVSGHLDAIAVMAVSVNKNKGYVTFFITGKAIQLIKRLKEGDPISMMGPTGVRTKIPNDKETIVIIGEEQSIQSICALGKAMREAGNRVLYIGYFKHKDKLYCQDKIVASADQVIWIVQQGDPVVTNRQQDQSFVGDLEPVFKTYEKEKEKEKEKDEDGISFDALDRALIYGSMDFIRLFQQVRYSSKLFKKTLNCIVSVYGPMQCMLKGVCAQCLQWQIDPETGERTKAVFACSWQDQPMEIVDLDHLETRLGESNVSEKLNHLWLEYQKA